LYGQEQHNDHQSSAHRAKETTLQRLNAHFKDAVTAYHENDRPVFRGVNYNLMNAINKLNEQGALLENFYQKYSLTVRPFSRWKSRIVSQSAIESRCKA